MMKKFLAATAFLLTLVSVSTSVLAQKSNVSPSTVKVDKSSVKYAETNAFSDGRGVWLEWKTSFETKNLGFFVYRVNEQGEKISSSESFVSGAYMLAREETVTNGSYSFFDPNGDSSSSYLVESYNDNGGQQSSVVFQTKMVENLAKYAGASSEELQNRARNAKPSVSRNDSVLPKDLAAEVSAYTLPADPVKQRWVAAQPGARIGTKAAGFYRVSRAELQNGGFDVNAPTSRWQLYVNGVEQAITVAPNGEYIEFYAKVIDTPYADTQVYFLVVGANDGKRIGSIIRRRIGSSVVSNSYSQFFYTKQRLTYFPKIFNGDAENIFGTFITGTARTINFNLSGIDFSAPTVSIDLTIQGLSQANHLSKFSINGTDIGNINGGYYQDSTTGRLTFPTSLLVEGANQLTLKSLNGTVNGFADTSVFDSMKVNFARRYQADQNRMSFYVPNYKNVYVENFSTPNIRIFDLTNSDTPILLNGLNIETLNGTYRVNIPSNRGRILYAVADSGLLSADSVTQNTPSTLSTTAHRADLVIISHKDFLTQAEDWANYRRSQGMVVEVVNIEDVYDEFNYGIFSADCIRDFLSYTRNNWQLAPRYVLLMGDATYDPKNYLGDGGNFLPTRLVDTVYIEVGSDDTLADFNDDGLAEMAVGRIPTRDTATVTLMLNKVMTFEQTAAQAPARGALFASDTPDGYDFEGSSARLCEQLPAAIPCTKINRDASDADPSLLTAMNAGKYVINYSGHGNAGAWSNRPAFFNSTKASQLVNSPNYPIFTMLTCLNGYFIQPTDSLSEFLLKNPNGGAVAAWASSGETTPDVQEVMALRFFNQLGAGNITRLGDLINDAKTTINFGRDVRLSWVLLGDPTMKVR